METIFLREKRTVAARWSMVAVLFVLEVYTLLIEGAPMQTLLYSGY